MDEAVTWTAPEAEEISCGMEINMYFPAEDERQSDWPID